MKNKAHGVGFNDKTSPSNIGGKTPKEYRLWYNMLTRCFYEDYQTKFPTYKGCSVSDNFLNYTFFYDWCQEQIGFDKKGWHLDKDILYKDNKMYSESTCIFVPSEINSFFTSCNKVRGEYPVGVSLQTGYKKYMATVCVAGKNKNLGRYNTVEEAFAVYKKHKEALCKQLALKWQHEIDPRLFNAMINWTVNYEV